MEINESHVKAGLLGALLILTLFLCFVFGFFTGSHNAPIEYHTDTETRVIQNPVNIDVQASPNHCVVINGIRSSDCWSSQS